MARYRTSGRLDDQVLTDGDRGFRGIDSYKEATSLEPGFVQTSENMRLIGDLAEVRKGIDFLAGSVTLTYNCILYTTNAANLIHQVDHWRRRIYKTTAPDNPTR